MTRARTFSVAVDGETHAMLQEMAAAYDRDLKSQVRRIIRQKYLNWRNRTTIISDNHYPEPLGITQPHEATGVPDDGLDHYSGANAG